MFPMIAEQQKTTLKQPLLKATDPVWAKYVMTDVATLLCDHAHCERKAASFALGLIQRYSDKIEDLLALSRLAREEMRHFELVLHIMSELGLKFGPLAPAGYAASLRQSLSRDEPGRFLDHLLIAGIIEARSCERFQLLVPYLKDRYPKISRFYSKLYLAERRHFELYFNIAQNHYCEQTVIRRLHELSVIESAYIISPDAMVRFHSGRPV